MNWDKLYPAAYAHFGCEYLSPDICAARRIGSKQLRKRHERKQQVGDTISHFRNLMDSENPPRTKQEAVKALSPIMAYLLWSIFKVLAVKIIEWAWDQYAEQQKMSGASQ